MTTTVVERWGSLSATGVATEAAFGTAVAATQFDPMTGNTVELDPSLFSPKVMFGYRDLNTFPLYGQNKNAGSVTAPLWPVNGIKFLMAAIGSDAQAGYGVIGSSATSSNTLNGATSAGATTVTLTSATGYTPGSFIQVDVNNTSTPTTAEVRKITAVSTNTLTLDTALTYAHSNGATTAVVVAPFTHSIQRSNTLPSLTLEKNLGGNESLQFAGARVNKYSLSMTSTNTEATATIDVMAKVAAVLATPTTITADSGAPYVFAEASLSLFGQTIAQCSTFQLDIENGLKDTFTMNSTHNLQFLTPLTFQATGKAELVFTSLDDATWGYWTQMINGTEGQLSFSLTHPSSGGTVTVTCPRVRIATYSDAVKMDDVIISTINWRAFLNLTTNQTISASVVNSQYLAL